MPTLSDVLHPEILPLALSLRPEEQTALALVWLCQQGHGFDLGSPANRRVSLRWWSEFLPGGVTLAARTCSTLPEFASTLASRLHGQVGRRGEEGALDRQVFAWAVAQPEAVQRATLDALERQAVTLTTLVRADIDLRKRKAKHGNAEAQEKAEPGTPREREREPTLFDSLDNPSAPTPGLPASTPPPGEAGPVLRGLADAEDSPAPRGL